MRYEIWEKKIIGILGCYELFEEGYSNKPKQTYPLVLRDEFGDAISSNQTIYRISKGQLISNELVYDVIQDLIVIPILPPKRFYESLSKLLDALQHHIFLDNQDKVKEVYNNILRLFSQEENISVNQQSCRQNYPKKDIFSFYCEMALRDVISSNSNGQFITTKDYNRYYRLMNCFPDSLQALLKNTLFQYAAFYKNDIRMTNQLVVTFQFANSNYDLLTIKYALNLKYQGN